MDARHRAGVEFGRYSLQAEGALRDYPDPNGRRLGGCGMTDIRDAP